MYHIDDRMAEGAAGSALVPPSDSKQSMYVRPP